MKDETEIIMKLIANGNYSGVNKQLNGVEGKDEHLKKKEIKKNKGKRRK